MPQIESLWSVCSAATSCCFFNVGGEIRVKFLLSTNQVLFISCFMFFFVCSECFSFPAQCSQRNEVLIHQRSQISPALDHNMKDWRVSRLSEVEKLVWGENLVLSALVKVCSFLRVQRQSLRGAADRVNWSVMQYVHFSGRPTGCAKGSLRTAMVFAGVPVTSKSHLALL